jgi:glutamate 5-kinase
MGRPRLVIKVGTSTLLEPSELPSSTFDLVAASLLNVLDVYDVVLVTSGAIGFGVRRLGYSERPSDVSQLQALASIGQIGLIEQWGTSLREQPIGQVLLSARELHEEASKAALLATFEAMWSDGVIPVVNENDAITSEEITFGDNDKLAALVAATVSAEYLFLLTDQDGIQTEFGTENQRRLSEVALTEAESHVSHTKSTHGTGGMASKIAASRIALDASVQPFIADARQADVVRRTLSGESGTKLV